MQIIGVVNTRALRFDTTDPVLYPQDVSVSSVELLKQTEFSPITDNPHNSMELLASSSPYVLTVRLSVRMVQVDSHWTDVNEI